MIELSEDTKRLLDAVIPAESRERIASRLADEVSENIPFCDNSNPKGMERIRFSVLRLLAEGRMKEDDVFYLAYIDWRDLFMAAGHGNTEDHKNWAKQVIAESAQQEDAGNALSRAPDL
jgi:hypothetical protein